MRPLSLVKVSIKNDIIEFLCIFEYSVSTAEGADTLMVSE